MNRTASRMVRLNRKLAWVLVLVTALVVFTGYGQSLHILRRRDMRQIHLVVEWLFITLLGYHFTVGTFLSRYRYRSTLGRIRKGGVRLATILRFLLRVSSWPLLVLSVIIVLSGLSWHNIVVLPFNDHLRWDALFFPAFILHVAAGAGVFAKRNLRRA